MAERRSEEYGRLCSECFDELILHRFNGMYISEFMNSPVIRGTSERDIEYYNEIFPER